MLFVSHNTGAVSTLCGHGLLLATGRLVFDGTAEEVVERYASSAAKEYDISFRADPKKPSITCVTVNRDALKRNHLQVKIDFESPWPLPTPIGGIVLRAASGEPVWGSNGRFHTRRWEERGISQGALTCEACNIPLVTGHYLVSVWLADWQTDHDSKIDALRIMIGNGELNSLRPPTSVNGHLDWPATWRSEAFCAEPASWPLRVSTG